MDKISKIIVSSDITIRQVMEKLDESAEKILFVVDQKLHLLGVITDGDVRRWILKNGSLDETAKTIMTRKPFLLKPGYDFENAKKLMKDENIECVPIVDKNNRLVSALWWTDLFESKERKYFQIQVPVVIMAGGKGTRLEPFTKVLPKALIPIGDKTVIEVIIEKFLAYGCTDFFVSINHKAGLIKSYFRDESIKYNIEFLQEDSFYGTAGSLKLLKNDLKGPFFVNNCDVIIDTDYSDILKFHNNNKNVITIVCSMKNFKIPYGVIETFSGGALKKIKEKPEYDFLVNTGMYIIEKEVLKMIPAGKFYHMTDLITDCKNSGYKIGVYPISENAWTDIGQMKELFSTFKKFGL